MRTSELIKQLQAIATTTPFDADVVVGDDWQSVAVRKVQHIPPHTFLELAPAIHEGITKQTDAFMRCYLSLVLTANQQGDLTHEQATDALFELLETVNERGPLAAIEHIREVEKYGFDGRAPKKPEKISS